MKPQYADYEMMLHKQAWTAHRITGLPTEDLASEAKVIFFQALESWDADTAQFGTYLWVLLRNGLNNYCRGEYDDTHEEITPAMILPATNLNPRSHLIWKEALAGLSDEAKDMASILLHEPMSITGVVGYEPPKILRGKLRDHMWAAGWTQKMYFRACREIKEVLKNL